MKQDQQLQYLSRLESQNDHLVSQMDEMDLLLRKIGFRRGLLSLKEAAFELKELERAEEDQLRRNDFDQLREQDRKRDHRDGWELGDWMGE